MKVRVILLAILMLTGCGKPRTPALAEPENVNVPERETAPLAPELSETDVIDDAYAKGVVTRKNGQKVAGHILLQCPGYLTVCSRINSSEPGSSERVPIEEVESVVLEESLDNVDPFWKELQEEMTIKTEQTN
jgi:hypothetical protein